MPISKIDYHNDLVNERRVLFIMSEKLRELWRKYRQLASYCLAGGCTTLVNLSLFYLLRYPLHLNENLANGISTVAAIIFAYAANKLFVFMTHCDSIGKLMREMFSFFAARGLTLGIELGGGFVLMTLIRFNEMLSKMSLTVIVLILNFIFSKLFIFREKDVAP